MANDIKYIKGEISDIKADFKSMMVSFEEKMENLNNKMENLDNKYASKNVERIVYGLVTIILSTIITAGIYFMIKGGLVL